MIPTMLINSETWDEVDKDTMKKMNDLQNTMLRYLLQTPRTTPLPALCWDFGTLPIQFRVSQKKLNFMKHIVNLGPETLANEVYKIQKEQGFPGLVTEVTNLTKDLNLPNITDTKTNKEWSKESWKTLVKKEILNKCENYLKEEVTKNNLKKLIKSPMMSEHFQTQEYIKTMNVTEARLNFKMRSHMLNVKFNYSHDKNHSKDLWKCDSCETSIDTQSHILWCPSYSDLRIGKNIDDDSDLIEYIKKVMSVREKLKLTK